MNTELLIRIGFILIILVIGIPATLMSIWGKEDKEAFDLPEEDE